MPKKNKYRLWESLVRELPDDLSDFTARDFIKCNQNWLRRNLKRFPKDVLSDYRLQYWASLNIDDYPVRFIDRTEFELDSEIRSFRNIPLNHPSSVASLLCERFRISLLLVSPGFCPICGSNLRIYNSLTEEIVYECEQCIWTQYPNGKEWFGPEERKVGLAQIIPPTTADLIRLGVLKPKDFG